jgi:hypothetical protein
MKKNADETMTTSGMTMFPNVLSLHDEKIKLNHEGHEAIEDLTLTIHSAKTS